MSAANDGGPAFRVTEGAPPVPKNFCVVCQKPNCNTLQHGKWACSDACCDIIIRGENKKSGCYLNPADPADNITLNNFIL